jgi:hypothetical protein
MPSSAPMPPPTPGEGWRSRTTAVQDDLRVEHHLAPAVPEPPVVSVPPAAGAAVVPEPPVVRGGRDDRRVAWWLWVLLGLVLLGLLAFALLSGGDPDDDVVEGAVAPVAPGAEEVEADQDGVGDDPAPQAEEPVDPAQQDSAQDLTAPPAAQDPAAQDPAAQDPAAQDPTAQDPAAQDPTAQDPAAQDPTAQDPAAQDPAAQDPTAQDPGSAVTADGRSLFPVDPARLAELAGQDLVGQRVLVQSVVPGEGFWIGVDEVDRVFVHAGASAPLGFEPAPGQRIDFDGFVKPNPPADSAEVHDIPEDQGAEQHRQQGHHVELRSATLAVG